MSVNQDQEGLPVVVIGGGLGGLSAAAILARHGFPVTLVEQHRNLGGYATTFNRAAGKFTFEVSLHATNTVAQGPMRRVFEEAGILDRIEMVDLPELCRIITPDHDMTWPQRDPDAIIDLLCQTFPSETNGIKGFFGKMQTIMEDAQKPFDPDSLWDKIRFPLTHKSWWGIRNMTLGNLLDKYIRDPKARTVLSIFWIYYLLPPSKLSGFIYLIATGAYIWGGGYYVKRRSQDLSYALRDAIKEAGGRILLETEAVGITMKDGAVSGVALKDGSTLKARAVISNVSVPVTMKMISQNAPLEKYSKKALKYLDKIATYRPSLSSFVVWLGLNQEIRGRVKCHQTFLVQHYDPEEAYQGCLACNPSKAYKLVTIYDNTYPGYSQPGTSSITIYMPSGYEPWRSFETDYLAGRKDAYVKEKTRITEELIEQVEKLVIPGLRSMIEVKEAATPLTNLRYTKNPEGAICGYEWSMNNSFMNRIKNTTPFQGLYLASAWSNPGGAYISTLDSGFSAYKALVKDWGKQV